MLRIHPLAALLLVLILALPACAPPPATTAPGSASASAEGGTLTRAMTSEPVDMDPQGPANSGLSLVLPYLFDTLVTRQADGKIAGLLADSWQVSPDAKTIDIKLKSGVKFHDGSPLDAAAVVFTFERFKEVGVKSPIAGDIKAISRVQALDDHTVRFSFDKPTATFWSTLAMPYAQMAVLQSDPNVQLTQINLDALVYLGYNCARAPFDDVRVRRALSHAIDKGEIIKTALSGLGRQADTLLPPSVLGYNADLQSYGQGFDPAKAKSLLAEAGFTQSADGTWQRGGKQLAGKLLTSTRAPNEAIATVIQSQLKAIGVPVEIQQLDSAALMKTTTEGDFDLLLWRYDWSDPDALNIYLGSSRIRQTNRVFYSNPKVDALLEQGLRELDPSKRGPIYQEAQKLILADAPWQPLYHPAEGMAVRSRVKGVAVGSLGRMLVNDVTLSGS